MEMRRGRAVVANEIEGDEKGKVKPVGKPIGVAIPEELQKNRNVENDER